MQRPLFLAGTLVSGILLSFSAVQAETQLIQKFPDGQSTTVLVKSNVHQILTLENNKREVSSDEEMLVTTDNGIRDKDGELRQRFRIDSIKAKLTMPGGIVLEFDSTKPQASSTKTPFDVFLDLKKANVNASWTLTRDKDNRVKAVDGRDKILDALDQVKRDLLKKQIDATYLQDTANQEMLRIPATPVNPGDAWELTQTQRLRADQSLLLKKAYTYRGEVDREGKKVHQIDIQTKDATYSIDTGAANPLKLTSSNLHPTTMEGVLYFDAELGQIREIRESVQIDGEIKFNLSGNEVIGQTQLNMVTSSLVQ